MHKIIVAEVREVQEIPGADNIQIGYVLGEPVVISKDTKVGTVGLYAEPDLQLSEEYCKMNNLFRDSSKNLDPNKTGFFDSNRRVRAQPFMKVKSCGYFAPMDSLTYCGENAYMDLQVGDQLDELNGFKLCQKYISDKTRKAMAHAQAQGKKKLKKVETPLFAQHVDTEQFKYNINRLRKGMILSFHHKQHGCFKSSARVKLWGGGVRKISDISCGDTVVGFDSKGNMVPSKVINTFLNGKGKDWLQLITERSSYGYGNKEYKVVCTPNHEIYTDKGFVAAGNLSVGDVLYHSNFSYIPSDDQVAALIGMHLGGWLFLSRWEYAILS